MRVDATLPKLRAAAVFRCDDEVLLFGRPFEKVGKKRMKVK
jgi:hypothetical protein